MWEGKGCQKKGVKCVHMFTKFAMENIIIQLSETAFQLPDTKIC